MERQFLNIVILLSFIISGCQQIPENNSNTIIQIENNDQDIKPVSYTHLTLPTTTPV